MTNLTVEALPAPHRYHPQESPEALFWGLFTDGRLEGDDSVRKVRSGRRLHRIQKERLYALHAKTFQAFIEEAHKKGQLGYGWVQAKKYLRMRDLPLDLLEGTQLSNAVLLQLALRKNRGEDMAALIASCQAGHALARIGKMKDAGIAKPSRLAAAVGRALRRATEGLAQLSGRREHHDLSQGWARELEDGMRRLVLAYAEQRGVPLHELWQERRSADRWEVSGGQDPAGSSDEKRSDDEQIDAREGGHDALPEGHDRWHEPVVRAVLAVLDGEEQVVLARHLFLALSGQPAAQLVAFLRDVGSRLADAPAAADLALWLDPVATGDLARRWPYLYNFFTAAQLPGFRVGLHSLRAVALPEGARVLLECACAYWPLTDSEAEEPKRLPAPLREGSRLLHDFLSRHGAASTQSLSLAWVEMSDLAQELDALQRDLAQPG